MIEQSTKRIGHLLAFIFCVTCTNLVFLIASGNDNGTGSLIGTGTEAITGDSETILLTENLSGTIASGTGELIALHSGGNLTGTQDTSTGSQLSGTVYSGQAELLSGEALPEPFEIDPLTVSSISSHDKLLQGNTLQLAATKGKVMKKTRLIEKHRQSTITIDIPAELTFQEGSGKALSRSLPPPQLVDIRPTKKMIGSLLTVQYGESTPISLSHPSGSEQLTFTISTPLLDTLEIGTPLVIRSSQDGEQRAYHTQTALQEEQGEKIVRFATDHLTYFNIGALLGDFVINNDDTHTTGSSVTLHMNITGATEMRFGNTSAARTAASWESYAGTKSRTLSAGTGVKTVYAAFRNSDGDEVLVEDQIIFRDDYTGNLPITSGLTLHFDTATSSTLTETAVGISGRDDQSGNSYHARQENAVDNQPDLVSDSDVPYQVLDFNGDDDFLSIQTLNYNNTTSLGGIFVCSVFKTDYNGSTSYSSNWAFLDYDRSEFFNFYIEGDGDLGLSYTSSAGGITDNSGNAALNDNAWHVGCASFDGSATNDTIITADGTEIFNQNRVANGTVLSDATTRYGFIGDGSEAGGYNAGRNNIYYDGRIGEIVYYEGAKTATERKEIECHLGEKRGVPISGCTDDTGPIATIIYTPETDTPGYVIAQLSGLSEPITITNNSGNNSYVFNSNGTYTFTFEDASGNTGELIATVNRITSSPTLTNQAPEITSHTGASSVTIDLLSGATAITTITAIDNMHHVIGEYGKQTLISNTRTPIAHHDICEPVVVASHRQRVNADTQRAPRISNKTSTGFDIKVDNYDSSLGGALTTEIDYLVVASGAHSIASMDIIASSSDTTTVACNGGGSYNGTAITFTPAFSNPPVVLHTVSSDVDTGRVISHVNGNDGTRQSQPTATSMSTVLHRSFNSCTHGGESIDRIAFSSDHISTPGGFTIDTVNSTDSIACCTVNGYDVNFTDTFTAAPQVAIVAQLGEDGGNGGYAVVHNNTAMTATRLRATIDEDGPGADRNHTNEPISAVSFDKESGLIFEDNMLIYAISGGADSGYFTISSNGDLSFLTGKNSLQIDDANGDNIYEVVVSVCDSHCNQQCATQEIRVRLDQGEVCLAGPDGFTFSGSIETSGQEQQLEQVFTGYFEIQDSAGLDSGWYTTIQVTSFSGDTTTDIISSGALERYATGVDLLSGDSNTGVVLATGRSSYRPADSTYTFILREPGTNQSKRGIYGTRPWMRLTIPPYTRPDIYRAQICYTLYEN